MTDFEQIAVQMKMHNMSLPAKKVNICIPDACKELSDCMNYFLRQQQTNMCWIPEYEKVAEWLTDNHGRGLLLYGDCGRGKSLLTRHVIPALLFKHYKKIVSVYDVQSMNSRIDDVLKKHLIALDDIGTEDIFVSYGNKRLAFAEIADAAEKRGKLLIISTNLTGSDILDKYGQRTMERIIATTRRIEFKGKSLRK